MSKHDQRRERYRERDWEREIEGERDGGREVGEKMAGGRPGRNVFLAGLTETRWARVISLLR